MGLVDKELAELDELDDGVKLKARELLLPGRERAMGEPPRGTYGSSIAYCATMTAIKRPRKLSRGHSGGITVDNNAHQVIAALACAIGLVLNDKPDATVKKKLNEALTAISPGLMASSTMKMKVKKMGTQNVDRDELTAIAYLGEALNRWASGAKATQVATSIIDAATLLGYKNMD